MSGKKEILKTRESLSEIFSRHKKARTPAFSLENRPATDLYAEDAVSRVSQDRDNAVNLIRQHIQALNKFLDECTNVPVEKLTIDELWGIKEVAGMIRLEPKYYETDVPPAE